HTRFSRDWSSDVCSSDLTNHLDMESIESLQYALEKYEGTLFFVSHDREFVSGLATRVIEILPSGEIIDYQGGYDDYLESRGIAEIGRASCRERGSTRRAG